MYIKIKCKSYSNVLLDTFFNNLKEKLIFPGKLLFLNSLSFRHKEGIYKYRKLKYGTSSLPNKRKFFTVLRSAHVHKKSREQFLLKTYSKCLYIKIYHNYDETFFSNISKNHNYDKRFLRIIFADQQASDTRDLYYFLLEKFWRFCKNSAVGINITFCFYRSNKYKSKIIRLNL